MTLFIREVVTSTFTVDVGIMGPITMAHGRLRPGGGSHRCYADIKLTISGVTVIRSSDAMNTIEPITMDDSTVPNSVVKERERNVGKDVAKLNVT